MTQRSRGAGPGSDGLNVSLIELPGSPRAFGVEVTLHSQAWFRSLTSDGKALWLVGVSHALDVGARGGVITPDVFDFIAMEALGFSPDLPERARRACNELLRCGCWTVADHGWCVTTTRPHPVGAEGSE